MIKIDRDISQLSDMGTCVKKDIWVINEKTLAYISHYWENNTPPKLSLFERLYKWLKTKMEK